MAKRRPPLNDRELLKLLEAGQSQTEAARLLAYPIGTVTARIAKLRERGILLQGNVVAWEVLDLWERDHQPKAYRETEDTEGNTHVTSDVTPKGIPQDVQFKTEEVNALREVIDWWDTTGRNTHVTPKVIPEDHTVIPEGITSKSRRTFWIQDGLQQALKDRAKKQGVSMAELVNEAIRAYLLRLEGKK